MQVSFPTTLSFRWVITSPLDISYFLSKDTQLK